MPSPRLLAYGARIEIDPASLRSGFVLPTAAVILGADDPGSAVSVPMPDLAIKRGLLGSWRTSLSDLMIRSHVTTLLS